MADETLTPETREELAARLQEEAAGPALPPLLRECPECHGQGTVQHPRWAEWWNDVCPTDRKPAPEPPAELLHLPEEVACQECGGEGRVPTEAGTAVLELIGTAWGYPGAWRGQ